jgi:hypothetical protein
MRLDLGGFVDIELAEAEGDELIFIGMDKFVGGHAAVPRYGSTWSTGKGRSRAVSYAAVK